MSWVKLAILFRECFKIPEQQKFIENFLDEYGLEYRSVEELNPEDHKDQDMAFLHAA